MHGWQLRSQRYRWACSCAGVGTDRGGRLHQQLSMGRDRRLVGADGDRLGGGGFLPQHGVVGREQALDLTRHKISDRDT